jgi:magnesium transporter
MNVGNLGNRRRRRRPPRPMPPPGSAPGTVMTDPAAPAPELRLFAYGKEGSVERRLASADELAPFLDPPAGEKDPASPSPAHSASRPAQVVWLDVDGVRHAPTVTRLAELFKLHRLTLADVVNTHQRAKIEDFGDYIFMVLRMPRRSGGIDTEQVSICFGRQFVVTFQEEGHPGDSFEPVRERLRQSTGRFLQFGPDYLAYALLDAVIDSYFPLLEELGAQLDTLEDLVLDGFDRQTSATIHLIRRDLITLRRAVWPLREAIGALMRDSNPLICPETRVYLRDCYDHTVQIIDLAESYRDVGSGLMEVYLAAVSNRLNEVMKVLTVIATIFIPLTFIVGVYGMNFDHMPELRWRYGYAAIWAVMIIVAGGMLLAFWRNGWIGPKSGRKSSGRPPSDPPKL